MLQSLGFGLILIMIIIFGIVVLVLMQGDCNKVISPLEISQTDEAAKDVNSILVNVSSEVRSWSEVWTIFYKKFSPGWSAQIIGPYIVIENRRLLGRNALTTDYDQHFTLIVNTAVSGSGGGSRADDFHFGYGQSRWRGIAIVIVVKVQFIDVIWVLTFISLAILPSKDVYVGLYQCHRAANFRL